MTEQIISDTEIQDFLANGGELPNYHTILEVWREVLKPAKAELSARVTPAWANRVITSYTGMTYADMNDYRDSYFTKLLKLEDILLAEIASDDECLSYTEPEEDAAENSQHYKNLLRDWQLEIMRWEMEWDTASPLAAVEVAAISEIHKMFFGQTGLTQYLDNIKFEYTEADQAELAEALRELREGGSE